MTEGRKTPCKNPFYPCDNLHVKFQLRGKTLHALRGVTLNVYGGESLAIVGESGCGKSVLNKNFIGLLDGNGFISEGRDPLLRRPGKVQGKHRLQAG